LLHKEGNDRVTYEVKHYEPKVVKHDGSRASSGIGKMFIFLKDRERLYGGKDHTEDPQEAQIVIDVARLLY